MVYDDRTKFYIILCYSFDSQMEVITCATVWWALRNDKLMHSTNTHRKCPHSQKKNVSRWALKQFLWVVQGASGCLYGALYKVVLFFSMQVIS